MVFWRIFGVDIFLPQLQTAANQWFWYKKTTSKRHEESSTYPKHVFVHPNFPPIQPSWVSIGCWFGMLVGMMGFGFDSGVSERGDQSLAGLLCLLWRHGLARHLGLNHDPCQCFKRSPGLHLGGVHVTPFRGVIQVGEIMKYFSFRIW